MGQAFLLTGRPGIGKTTIIQAVAQSLGRKAGGFYTQEIREGERRIGFRLVALDGPTGLLASVNESSPYRVGKYRVRVPDLDRIGIGALRRAVTEPGVAVIVIDEIGKMELFSAAFRQAVQEALASSKPMIATVMTRSDPWVDAIKSRSDATLVEVTVRNRQTMPECILDWLKA